MAAPRVLGLTAFSMASPPVYVNSILPASKSYLEVVEKSLLPEQATIRFLAWYAKETGMTGTNIVVPGSFLDRKR
jgi:hypothetical protein